MLPRFVVVAGLAGLVAWTPSVRAAQDITLQKVSGPDDDVSDPTSPALRACGTPCNSVHYVIRIINCGSSNIDRACTNPNAAPITGGFLRDDVPASLTLDCARGVDVAGDGTSAPPVCDAAGLSVTVPNVTVVPGGTLTVSFWATVSCTQGLPWNHASFEYDQNPTPGRPAIAYDPAFPVREGMIFSIGGATPSAPTKDAPGLPIPRDQRLTDHGRPQTWVIDVDNPDCLPMQFSEVWDQLDIPDCVTVDCSTLRTWFDGVPRALPPHRCPDGANLWTLTDLVIPPHEHLQITFDSVTTDDTSVVACCNQAWFRAVGQTDPVRTSDPISTHAQPAPTCISMGLGVASRFDGIKIAEDAAGNEIVSVDASGDVYWRIRLINNGNFPITAAFDDDFPAETPLLPGAIVEPPPTGTCTITGQHLSCTGVVMPAMGTTEMRVHAPVDCGLAPGGTRVCNQATANAPGVPQPVITHCPDCVNGSPANLTCVLVQTPNFEFASKTARDADGDGVVALGETITYSIEPLNTGAAPATLVVVRDRAPARTTIVPGSLRLDGLTLTDAADADAGEIAGDAITVRVGSIATWAFGQGVVTFAVRADAPLDPQICNDAATLEWAEATPCRLPPHAIPAACLPAQVVVAPPDLSITKAVAPRGPIEPGDALTYTLHACNAAGAGSAASVVVADDLPAGATPRAGSLTLDGAPLTDAADADAGTLDVAGRTLSVALGTLAPGACRDVTVVVVADAVGTLINTATVAADGVAPLVSNGVRTDVTRVTPPPPVLSAAKTLAVQGGPTARVGSTITYVVEACNALGAGTADDIVIEDQLPLDATTLCSVSYVAGSLRVNGVSTTDAADGDAGEIVGSLVRAHASALLPDDCLTLTFDVTVDATCDDGETIANVGKVSALGIGPFETNTVTEIVRGDVPPEPTLLRKEGLPLVHPCGVPWCDCRGLRLDPVTDDCVASGSCTPLDPVRWLVPGDLGRHVPLVFYELTLVGCEPDGDPARLAVTKIAPGDVLVSLVP